jgi:Bacteriocin-protection, YdeI or OmpD-Associated/Domain of unknown function (DUF1905)
MIEKPRQTSAKHVTGKKYSFRAVIEHGDGGGAGVVVPFDVEQAFGKKRVPIKATIDGVPYRGSLVRMGGPCHLLIVLKEIREKIGKGPGDEVDIVLEEDTEPRVVRIPANLEKALKNAPGAKTLFTKLSYTHQREYVRWIEGAKRPETRTKRIAQAIDLLARHKAR